MFYAQHIIAALAGGLQLQVDLRVRGGRFVDDLIFSSIFSRLSPADGFLPVEGPELFNDCFLMTDLLLLIYVCLQLCLLNLLFLGGIIRIISKIGVKLSLFDLHHLGDYPVEKVPVVGDDENRPLVIQKVGLQPGDGKFKSRWLVGSSRSRISGF